MKVTNAGGNVTSSGAILTVLLPPSITTQPLSQTTTQGLNATFSVVASGTAPFSYQWQFRGTDLARATNATLVVTNLQLGQAGNYQVRVTNPWGAALSALASLIVVVPPGSDLPVMQGLVAHLTFDTDLTDSSGRGNHAAAVGAPNLVPGFIGTGSFNPFTQNGTNNYATLGTDSDFTFDKATDFSIAFWARLPAGGWSGGSTWWDPVFISNKDWSSGANVGWVLCTAADGELEWNYTEAGNQKRKDYYGPAGVFGNPVWHHVAVTFQRTKNAITYFDGVPVSTNSIGPGDKVIDSGLPTNIGNDGTGNYSTSFGYWTNAFGNPTNGLAMDDVGIWRRVVTAKEICAIYNAGLAGQDLATVTSNKLTTTVLPRITQQPASREVVAGSPVVFSVTASGPAPFGYQWFANGVPIAGANGASLGLSNAQPASAGSYYVLLTNSAASLTSAVATLTVDAPPSITAQPQSQAVIQGENASFSVVAGGTAPLSYQWSLNGAALSGATNSTLTLNSVQTTDAGSYTVVVGNIAGSITSEGAALTVNVPPTITSQPPNQTVTRGQNASFSVEASGTAPLSYQWSLNGTPLSGATSSALTLTSAQTTDAGSYAVAVANVAGSMTSAEATLTVLVPPTIATPPQSLTVTQGQSASFSVTASGTAPLSYQWSLNGTPLPGTTSSTLTLTGVQTTDASSYAVVVANVAGSITSAVATLTVVVPPTILTQPQSQVVAAGQNATLSVTASGTDPLSYQWSLNGTPLSDATSSTLTLNSVQTTNAGSYTVMVANPGGSAPSAVAMVTVTNPTANLSLPTGAGMSRTGFTFQVSVPAGLTYVILATTNLRDWTPVYTNVAESGTFALTDPGATSNCKRFYRAMLQ